MTAADLGPVPGAAATPTRPAEYAAAVRRHLDHLSPEQREELTGGLEADLAEALGDRSDGTAPADLTAVFGPPAAYAEELCRAAGLPVHAERSGPRSLGSVLLAPWTTLRSQAEEGVAELRKTSWGPGLEEFVLTLRPVGWVVRGWAVIAALGVVLGLGGQGSYLPAVFPTNLGHALVMLAAVVVSIQWGRGRWLRGGTLGWLRGVTTTLAVVAIVPILGVTASAVTSQGGYRVDTEYIYTDPVAGVWVDGEQATNLFAYDADGVLVERFQLVDQEGRAVVLTETDSDDEFMPVGSDEALHPVAALSQYGDVRRNVFPRIGARWEHLSWLESQERWLLVDPDHLVTPSAPVLALSPLLAPGVEPGSPQAAGDADGSSPPTSPTPSSSTSPPPRPSGSTPPTK